MKYSPQKHVGDHGIDDAIDRTLAGLRDTPVPEGMERRILKALEESGSDRSRPRRSPIFPWKIAGACATVAAVALFFILMPGRQHTPRGPAGSHSNPQPTARTAVNPHRAATIPSTATNLASNTRPHPPREQRLHRTTAVTSTGAEATEPDHSHVNLPPPPLPLTSEERMLQQIAHARAPFELAMLTPDRRAAQQQRERAEFDQFFAPSEAAMEAEKLNSSQTPERGKP
ncbi:hypothetical protein JAO29_18455 [Edaphobacter sp. HDX4]|uniref:hypothetical protein n=1 Tax=Edaphobacter sp. HDX4 TaxID=2794064 RepID=UPI002FE64911